ncbi:MAG TPA: hypothetical protein PKK60_00765 [archaeon]|nr:hypothetical protein [archaeon]
MVFEKKMSVKELIEQMRKELQEEKEENTPSKNSIAKKSVKTKNSKPAKKTKKVSKKKPTKKAVKKKRN